VKRQLPEPIAGTVEYGRVAENDAFKLEAPLNYVGYEHEGCVHAWTDELDDGMAWAMFVDLKGSRPIMAGVQLGSESHARSYAEDTFWFCTKECCPSSIDAAS
jgi:hypothetical protein